MHRLSKSPVFETYIRTYHAMNLTCSSSLSMSSELRRWRNVALNRVIGSDIWPKLNHQSKKCRVFSYRGTSVALTYCNHNLINTQHLVLSYNKILCILN